MIKSEEEYKILLGRLEELFQTKDPDNSKELDKIADLIEEYENEHYPIGLPDPIDAIKFRLEQNNQTEDDLEKYIGSDYKKVLNKEIEINEEMKKILVKELGISEEVLNQ